MGDYGEDYPQALVRDLLWCRNYHTSLIKEIDKKLMEVSKKYEMAIKLE